MIIKTEPSQLESGCLKVYRPHLEAMAGEIQVKVFKEIERPSHLAIEIVGYQKIEWCT